MLICGQKWLGNEKLRSKYIYLMGNRIPHIWCVAVLLWVFDRIFYYWITLFKIVYGLGKRIQWLARITNCLYQVEDKWLIFRGAWNENWKELWELILVSSFVVLDLEHVHLNVVRNISSWWGYFLLVFVFTMLFVLQTWNSPPSTFCLTTCISLLHFVKNLSVNLQRNNEGCSMASVLHFSYILPE